MRPRISREEATYLVTVLQGQLRDLEQKLSDVEQTEKDLDKLLSYMKNPVQPEISESGCIRAGRIISDKEMICYLHISFHIFFITHLHSQVSQIGRTSLRAFCPHQDRLQSKI